MERKQSRVPVSYVFNVFYIALKSHLEADFTSSLAICCCVLSCMSQCNPSVLRRSPSNVLSASGENGISRSRWEAFFNEHGWRTSLPVPISSWCNSRFQLLSLGPVWVCTVWRMALTRSQASHHLTIHPVSFACLHTSLMSRKILQSDM